MRIHSDVRVKEKFKSYPKAVQSKLKYLRKLILDTADAIDDITELEETLKWGEPSYLVKHGSTLRIDWKAKKPEQYVMYFKCTSKLVPTIKKVYGDTFNYETTRAIVFGLDDNVPEKELKECIRLTLCYHKLKEKPLLGIIEKDYT